MSDGAGVAALVAGVRAGERTAVGRALTLVESRLEAHRAQADELLAQLTAAAGGAARVGVSGPPGSGKSTLIESLGCHLIAAGHRVAVLAVDPSSTVSGGSILGDKTRMTRLAQDARAFVRPSPSGGTLGGVTPRTREAMLVLEAAGHDVVLVETVGVGQSETAGAAMVDCFVVVLTPGGGDELQGIKRGILELADLVVINKADGEGKAAAERARRDFSAALRLLHGAAARPPVLAVSALTGEGVPALWDAVTAHRRRLAESGGLESRRAAQRRAWMWELVEDGLRSRLRASPELPELEAAVAAGVETPARAAARLLRSL